MIYTITWNPALDYYMRMDAWEEGKTNRVEEVVWKAGGKGINVSRMLRNLDISSTICGVYAGFTGDALVQRLEEEGLPTALVQCKRGNTRVNVKLRALSIHDDALRVETEWNGPGVPIDESAWEAIQRQMDALTADDVVIVSGSVGALSLERLDSLFSKIHERQAKLVVDMSGEALLRSLSYEPLFIKPNRQELELYAGKELKTHAQLAEVARELRKRGAQHVLVSLGGEGAYLCAEREFYAKAPRGKVQNTVGAGDSMVAGFVAAWMQAKSLEDAFRYAIASGSATAFAEDFGEKQAVEELEKHIEVEVIR